MISTGQILAAGALTGIAVALAAAAMRWSLAPLAAAALSSFALIVVWRAISNLAGLNGDFLPAVSVGDTGCLVAGALGPAVVARLRRAPTEADGPAAAGPGPATGFWSAWAPVLAGGIAGFVVNVVILSGPWRSSAGRWPALLRRVYVVEGRVEQAVVGDLEDAGDEEG